MRNVKIFLTFLLLYEFAIITVLHVNSSCAWLFNQNFCVNNFFKYFVMSVMVPGIIMMVVWWWPKKKDTPDSYKNYMVKFIIVMVVVAMRYLVRKYPKTKRFFNEIADAIYGVGSKR